MKLNNQDIVNPNIPEIIEEYLKVQNGIMKCVAFNRRGTLLAAGCADGRCIIWDFETRVIAKELDDKDCAAVVISVCWSRCGNYIIMSAADKSLIYWDVLTGEIITRIVIQHMPFQVRLHPRSCSPPICLVSTISSAPMIVDLTTGTHTSLPISVSTPLRSKRTATTLSATACFSKCGDLVYVGNYKGEILIVDHKTNQVLAMLPSRGDSILKSIVLSRKGQYVLTNSYDGALKLYENRMPVKDGLKAVEELKNSIELPDGEEKITAVGLECLAFISEFEDPVTNMHWRATSFSGDEKWVVSGSASKGEHMIYIWNGRGQIVNILEGPKEGLIDLAFHPVHPIIVSVSMQGVIYIWSKEYFDDWSAFAPGFRQLDENVEYVEREDEFDLNPREDEPSPAKVSDVDEDDFIDVTTLDVEDYFSDLDMSREELCHLPVSPCPDKVLGPENLTENKLLESPLPDNTGNNENMDYPSSPQEEEDTLAALMKKKRKRATKK